MKLTNLWSALLAATLFVAPGCKKQRVEPVQKDGNVSIDMRQVYDLAHGSSPEVQAAVSRLETEIRYTQYLQALADLDKIANDPSLSAEKKKEAEVLIGQVKELAKNPPSQ